MNHYGKNVYKVTGEKIDHHEKNKAEWYDMVTILIVKKVLAICNHTMTNVWFLFLLQIKCYDYIILIQFNRQLKNTCIDISPRYMIKKKKKKEWKVSVTPMLHSLSTTFLSVKAQSKTSIVEFEINI